MLYGENPVGDRHRVPLRAAMTLRAIVIALRKIGRGESVGYNGHWTSARPTLIATLGIGYGNGYPRHERNGTPVWINGRFPSLAGQVSMDSLTIDVTDCSHVAVGDEAILWGADVPVSTIAKCADTISYELFTSLHQRVGREYTKAMRVGRGARPDPEQLARS